MKDIDTNEGLVEFLRKEEHLRTSEILEAFRAVDRADFASPTLRTVAYRNHPVQEDNIHLSAPFIYAEALEELRPKPGMSFLNIGSGTCYLSYLVSMLIGELGVNHGVELSPMLLEHSARCIATTDQKLGRKTDIQVLQGNGMNISAETGYDCIYVGAGCIAAMTMDYLKGLLNVGGVMVAPFDDELLRVERLGNGTFKTQTLCHVCFSPIVMPRAKHDGTGAHPPIRFVVRPWSPACHSVYPESFRKAVLAVLLANARQDSLSSIIPSSLWMEVMSFARRDWFSERVVAESKAHASGASQGLPGKGAAISQGCLGAAKSMALIPVKASSAAASQIGCHVS